MISTSCIATTITILYISLAIFNFYKIMNPLFLLDLSEFPKNEILHSYWNTNTKEYHQIKVYLSTAKRFDVSFLSSDDDLNDYSNMKKTVLLWDDFLENSQEIKKELVLSTSNTISKNKDGRDIVINETVATTWFQNTQDFFENSWIINGLRSISSFVTPTKEVKPHENIIKLSTHNPIWKSLHSNQTVYVHALIIRHANKPKVMNLTDRIQSLQHSFKSHSIVSGQVTMVKYDAPVCIKPKRILYKDLVYFYEKYVLGKNVAEPWDFSKSSDVRVLNEYTDYITTKEHKEKKVGYPYWKPEVSIRLIPDTNSYPYGILHQGAYPIIKVPHNTLTHPSGYAYLPPIHVDEIGLTSDKYIPLNTTITALPLRISFDSYTLTPQRWRLVSHFSQSLNQQNSAIQLDNEDIDEFRHLIADTNVNLLCVILLASILHLLFEFLTFKNDVQFWQGNSDITGLSIRALFSDLFCQFIITLYLIEKNSSLLVTVPSGIGVGIALWKCYKGAGLAFVKGKGWFLGYELQATRLQKQEKKDYKHDLAELTIEMDKLATNTLSKFLIPPLLSYAVYSLLTTPYTSWYSYLITTTSSFVYGLGFIFMTPQLFLNYKLKSVAHLPWKVLIYKFLNTFIDDLFALVIRMPTMAKIGVFRDDIVFFIYLGQRWCYDVDVRRPVEGGGSVEDDKEKKE